jgi:raffinose/stachyose/melibiose transport system substrate-binding protein
MSSTRTGAALITALVVASTALAACGDDDDDSGGGSGDELVLWHYEAPNSAMGMAWDQAIKEFKRTHPGVEVKFEAKGFEQMQRTASMVLNSDDAPDLMEYNKGNSTTGLLSQQGLLTDMTDVVEERGWDDMLAESVQTTCRYEDGVMGSGSWYGIPNYAEYTMVYYNKNLFEKYGVEVPTTFDELVAAADTFVDNGVTPFANAGKEYPAQQYLYQLALSQADRDWVNAYELYEGDVDFHDDAWTYAAETYADWVDKGYFGDDSAGLGATDAGDAFTAGKTAMFFSGSWWYGTFASEISSFDWGTFLWPGSDLTLGSSGNLWVVPENAENKELAYDFIDITMQSDIQTTLGNHGGVPVGADMSAITDPKNQELIDNYDAIVQRDGLAFYPDWPVAGFYDTLVAEVQKLLNGDASPDEVLDNLQGEYDAGLPQ